MPRITDLKGLEHSSPDGASMRPGQNAPDNGADDLGLDAEDELQ